MKSTISLCQPGNGKACSACCGLFNFKDISRDFLDGFLSGRYSPGFGPNIASSGYGDDAHLPREIVRDYTTHICRYQRYISDGTPGCSLHPSYRGTEGRDSSFYGTRICRDYLCPAYLILDERNSNLLINMVDDWYLYSMAIIDPEGFAWIVGAASSLEKNNREAGEQDALKLFINRSLALYSTYLVSVEGPVFFHSLAEYNENKKYFSLSVNSSLCESILKEVNPCS